MNSPVRSAGLLTYSANYNQFDIAPSSNFKDIYLIMHGYLGIKLALVSYLALGCMHKPMSDAEATELAYQGLFKAVADGHIRTVPTRVVLSSIQRDGSLVYVLFNDSIANLEICITLYPDGESDVGSLQLQDDSAHARYMEKFPIK